MQTINFYLSKYAQQISISALFLIIILGSYFRVYGVIDYSFGLDDYDHIRLSTGENLWNLILNSYRDAHPPLRNIFLNLIMNFSHGVFSARLVSSLPGILLIPAIYLLVLYIFKSKIAALLAAIIISFSELFIVSSQGTRPYTLAALLLTIYLYSWIALVRNNKRSYFLIFFFSGLAVVLADYGAIAIILSVSIIGFSQLLSARKFKSAALFAGISTLHLALFLTQIYLVYELSDFRPEEAGHVSIYMKLGLADAFNNLNLVFSRNLSNAQTVPYFMLSMYVLGIFISIKRKYWSILFLGLLPFIAYWSMSRLMLYPFGPGRFSILLSLTLLIPICLSIKCIFELNQPSFRFIQIIFLCCILLIFVTPQFSLSNPSKFSRTTNIWDAGLSQVGYKNIQELINSKILPVDIIATDFIIDRILLGSQKYYPNLTSEFEAKSRFYCNSGLFSFANKRGFYNCIAKLKQEKGNEIFGKRYAYLISSFDPNVIAKDPKLPVVFTSITQLEPERPHYVFTFKFKERAPAS